LKGFVVGLLAIGIACSAAAEERAPGVTVAGSAHAAVNIPPNYAVLVLRYEGCQEKPIYPVVLGDSADSVAWYDSTYINNHHDWFVLVRKHKVDSSSMLRLVSDVPSLSTDAFVGHRPGKELEIAVVERGQIRHAFTRSELSDALLSKFAQDSGEDAEARRLILEFKEEVDRYARLLKCSMPLLPRAL